MAATGQSEMANRLRAAIESGGEGLKSLAFAINDVDRAHRRCERVDLAPAAIQQRETLRSFRIGAERANGVRVFLLQREAPAAGVRAEHVLSLDHVVIRSSDMDRAAAFYGARLGLDLRLDREVAGRRLMFFRCGGVVVEIAHDEGVDDDRLWGLSWRVADADAARGRLAAAGLNVSDVRACKKPGTRVFSVKNGTCGAPTLMIEANSPAD